jgi:hypothetical protein
MTNDLIAEEPDEVKVSRPVLETNGVGDNLVEFNVVANDNSTLKVFLGLNATGMNKFDTAPKISQGVSSPRGIIVTDINGDARPDIIIGDAFAGFNIQLHTQPSTAATNTTVAHRLNLML